MRNTKIFLAIFFFILALFLSNQFISAENCGDINYEKDSTPNPSDSEDSSSSPSEITGDYGKVEMSSPGKSKSKPELYVKELSFKKDKTKYYNDEKGHVDFYGKNVGTDVDKKIDNIKAKLYRFKGEKENGDVKEIGSENIKGGNLEFGDTKHEEFEFDMPSDEGKYQLFAVIDASNVVKEDKENNNRLGNLAFRVHKRPDIKVKELLLDGGKTQFIQGIVFEARKTSKNDGGESFEDIPVKWYLNGVFYAEDNMRHWNIEHGEEKHESINVDTSFLAVGMHTLKVCADCDADKDKGNNCKEVIFEVIPVEEEISSEEVLSEDSAPESSLETEELPEENSEVSKSDEEESEASEENEIPEALKPNGKKVTKPTGASNDESGCFAGVIF